MKMDNESDCANSSTSSDGSSSPIITIDTSVPHSSLNIHRQSSTSLELPNSSSSLASFSTEDSDQKLFCTNEMTRDLVNPRSTLFAFSNEPSCSKTLITMEKRPKLQRIGEKLKNFITHRDQQHSTQFRKLFSDSLAKDEHLVSSFSCLYYSCSKRLIPGRLFVSFRHIAFNSNNYSTRFIISFSNVDCIEKTSQKVFTMNGGIQIVLDDGVCCKFGSFSSQDKVYTLLSRLWKSNDRFINQPTFTLPTFPSQASLLKMGETHTDGSNIAPTQTDTASQASQATEDTKSIDPVQCDCTEHKGQLMLDSVYHMSSHQLFSLLFTQNKLMDEFLVSTKRTDVKCDSWSAIEGSRDMHDRHKHKRTVTYTVELSNSWGPKSSDVKEQQELTEVGKKASDGYFVKKEASNSGVPYADSFNIYCTYCISRISSNSCRMKVYSGVEFKKSIMGMFKGFIERSALSGITDYYKHLDDYLNTNTTLIHNNVRIKAGSEFVFETSSQGSFRSMAASNDGYDSDVDERKEVPKKRLVKSLSYIPSNTVQSSQMDHKTLNGINQSLRIIAFTLLLLLLIQLWSTFFPSNSTSVQEPTSTELLYRLIQHVQDATSLEEAQQGLVDIERLLPN